MIFYFLIFIVFISEIIIGLTIILSLKKFDNKINECNSLLEDVKPVIKDILYTCRQLSEHYLKTAPIIADKINKILSDFILGQLKNALGALTFWLVKKEVEKHV